MGVSENDAIIITGLFETALVKTESFEIIEQNQIESIMEAQAYSLGGCTDESCAIEVGKLLSAEQIILGDLSAIGSKIILNAKIIDVELGRNIKADTVDAQGMEEMTEAVELLAYKLAGLTFAEEGDVRIARTFGEALVETVPSGADIYINGSKKGVSPDLVTRIPLGTVRIEAKLGNLYGMNEVTITEDTSRISLQLEEQYGNLFIKSSEDDVSVYLDGTLLGPLGSGFFNDLSVGEHILELKGSSTYWKDDVVLEAGVSTKVQAYPRNLGYLSYSLPDETEAEITGMNYRQVIRGTGRIQVFEGDYKIKAYGGKFISLEEQYSVSKGSTISFSPDMEYTAVYKAKLTEDRRNSTYSSLSRELEEKKKIVMPGYRITDSDLWEVEELGSRISKAEFSFPDLLGSWESFKAAAGDRKKLQDDLADYKARRQELDIQKQLLENSKNSHFSGGWVAMGIGAGSAILSAVSFTLSWVTYQDYLDADQASYQSLKDSYKMWDMVGYVSAGTAVLGAGLAPLIWNTGPGENDSAGVVSELAMVNSEISRLEVELK